MATLGTQYGLADVARSLDPQGRILRVADVLERTKPLIADIPWVEGNMPDGHKVGRETALPTARARRLNQGIESSKELMEPVKFGCTMVASLCDIDKAVADMNGNSEAWRLRREQKHIVALGDFLETEFFYGNESTNPTDFDGLAVRFGAMTASDVTPGYNIVDMAGADPTANQSLWLIGWAEDKVYGIYPKGSKAGLKITDSGSGSPDGCVDLLDASGRPYRGMRTYFEWNAGLCIEDWRYVVRGCDVGTAALVTAETAAAGGAAVPLMRLAAKMLARIPSPDSVKLRWYCNRTIFAHLAMQNTNMAFANIDLRDGNKIPFDVSLLGIPVRLATALVSTEALVGGTAGAPA